MHFCIYVLDLDFVEEEKDENAYIKIVKARWITVRFATCHEDLYSSLWTSKLFLKILRTFVTMFISALCI